MPYNPPRDVAGKVVPHDEVNLPGASGLIRRIHPDHLVPDDTRGGMRISSGLFSATSRDPHYGMSVDLEHSLHNAGLPSDHLLSAGDGAVRITVSDVRALGLPVGSDPVDAMATTPANPHHGQVWGVRSNKGKKLSRLARSWVRAIPGCHLR